MMDAAGERPFAPTGRASSYLVSRTVLRRLQGGVVKNRIFSQLPVKCGGEICCCRTDIVLGQRYSCFSAGKNAGFEEQVSTCSAFDVAADRSSSAVDSCEAESGFLFPSCTSSG